MTEGSRAKGREPNHQTSSCQLRVAHEPRPLPLRAELELQREVRTVQNPSGEFWTVRYVTQKLPNIQHPHFPTYDLRLIAYASHRDFQYSPVYGSPRHAEHLVS